MLCKEQNMTANWDHFQCINVTRRLRWDESGCVWSPVDDASVHHFKNDDSVCAVFEELRHFALQLGFGLMLGHYLQVVPGCLALPLQLNQVVRQLLKVHLEKNMKYKVWKLKKKKKSQGHGYDSWNRFFYLKLLIIFAQQIIEHIWSINIRQMISH